MTANTVWTCGAADGGMAAIEHPGVACPGLLCVYRGAHRAAHGAADRQVAVTRVRM